MSVECIPYVVIRQEKAAYEDTNGRAGPHAPDRRRRVIHCKSRHPGVDHALRMEKVALAAHGVHA